MVSVISMDIKKMDITFNNFEVGYKTIAKLGDIHRRLINNIIHV